MSVLDVLREPGVDVALVAGVERAVALVEPAEEVGRVFDLLGSAAANARRDVTVLGSGPESGKNVPGREEPDRLDMLGIGDAGQMTGNQRWKEPRAGRVTAKSMTAGSRAARPMAITTPSSFN
ncbi:hypothetical protein OIE67_21630 [Nonomuraea fuscirosea]|uniref:hypothetical protein n=1 Tax=Nonomuraea fuscirosea TaxID=1291556 RepID=UPI002DDA3D9E|nr:hypothetical protein [Nonomuraea fuscirosea]WSA57115.1 hypothetical protein OIE67_21630 [Nonomuraea fuscirosea]